MTKPKDTALSILNDFLPRIGVVREGQRQTLMLGLTALSFEVIKRSWFKQSTPLNWFKRSARSIIYLVSRISWLSTLTSAYYYREPETGLLGRDDEFLYAPR